MNRKKHRFTVGSEGFIDGVGDIIFGTRWGLVPMYLGLWIAIIAYNVKFGKELISFLFGWNDGIYIKDPSSEEFLMWVLSLIDITMIANLVVMTTIGGYSTFVKQFDLERLGEDKPRWMNGLDSSTLKIKMSMSLIAVTAIHLLRTFMELEHVPLNQVIAEIAIHLTFIVTTLAFTFNSILMHRDPRHKNDPEGH